MWLEEYHADGLRWDMIVFIKSIDGNAENPANDIPDGWSLMQWINVEIPKTVPRQDQHREGLHKNVWVTKDVGAGAPASTLNGMPLLCITFASPFIACDDRYRDLEAVSKAIEHRYDQDAFKRIIYTESHGRRC